MERISVQSSLARFWGAGLTLTSRPAFRAALFACVLLILCSANVYAQQPDWGTSSSLDETSTSIADYVYNTARWPICGALLVVMIGLYAWAENGRRKAAWAGGMMLVWALAPWWISMFRLFTGS